MKFGNQEPTFSHTGDYSRTNGPEVAEMFELDGGATFYPSQKIELDLMLARNKDGSPSATTIGITKPRQNGKSYSGRYYSSYLGDFEHRDTLYSAHHGNTSRKMFDAMCDLFDSPERYMEFSSDVKRISRARGYEGIYFKDWKDGYGTWNKGGCIEFSTRTNSGARGGTYSSIIFDEAQELTVEQQEATLPVTSASADASNKGLLPQQIYIGTVPGPSCNGTVFRDMHDTAHSSDPGDVWWIEWGIEGKSLDELGITRENVLELAYKYNPAMGYRMAEKTILNEFDTMSLDGFARERLGWWTPVISHKDVAAINSTVWDACSSEEMKPEGRTGYGVKFSADGSEVCLCGAVVPADGPARISLIEKKRTGEGIAWLAEWLNERAGRASVVVIDGRNGVDILVDRIVGEWKYKDSIIKPSAHDVVSAAGLLVNEINEGTVTWYFGQEDLSDSATTSTKRPIGGGWGFGGPNSTPIEAAALALWGVRNTKRDPSKKMRIG